MVFQVQIQVTLRPSVLDPAGAAVEASLHQLGYVGVQQLRIGKLIQFQLDATDLAQAQAQTQQMCEQMLANPVIEGYQIQLDPIPLASSV